MDPSSTSTELPPREPREIVRAYELTLARAVRRRRKGQFRSKFDTEDIVQSVWKSVLLRGNPTFEALTTKDAQRAFLLRVAHNKLIDMQRRGQKGGVDIQALEIAALLAWAGRAERSPTPDRAPTPSELVVANETRDQLLEGESERNQRIIGQRIDGWKVQEIADQTGLNARTVRRVLRSRAQRVRRGEEPRKPR